MDDQKKVLLIEDSNSFASMIAQLIDLSHGYPVDICHDLKSSKALLEENPDCYFAAIVDLNLPDAPSGEAVDYVAKFNLPIIVFTGLDGVVKEEDLWDKGIADYAHKSGTHSLEYIVWIVKRLHENENVGVLVVDDSTVARKNVVRRLRTHRFKTYQATSGDEALALIDEHPDIQVALIDCYMSGMDGFELAMTLRTKRTQQELEIIGMSAQGGRDLSAKFIKSGANDFLLKPFVPEELLCRVNNCADRIQSYTQLKRMNAAKNEVLSTAAHDIRGPIGAIKTASYHLKKENITPERHQFLVNMIHDNCTSMLELLESLLDMSSIESGDATLNRTRCDLATLIRERVELYSLEAESKAIEITSELDSISELELDTVKIKQVIDNLISNAIKYSPSQSSVMIRLMSDDACAKICVQDAGPGIPPEEQHKLFKPFTLLSPDTTANEARRGLGLSIAKSIVDAHGGSIDYKHDDSQPSCFYVELPMASA